MTKTTGSAKPSSRRAAAPAPAKPAQTGAKTASKPAAKPAGKRLQARQSGVHGKGVYANVALKKGERLIEYKGEVISWKEALRRHPHDPKDPNHTFYFHIDDKHVIDAKHGGNEARWINHSCSPNCESNVEDGRVFIDALRDIQPGEELFYDYGLVIDEPLTAELKAEYPCWCGSPNCRGTLLASADDKSDKKKKEKKSKDKAKNAEKAEKSKAKADKKADKKAEKKSKKEKKAKKADQKKAVTGSEKMPEAVKSADVTASEATPVKAAAPAKKARTGSKPAKTAKAAKTAEAASAKAKPAVKG